MLNTQETIKTLRILNVVWFLAINFSAIMLVISLIINVIPSVILALIMGILSLMGIIYSEYLIIKINNQLKYQEYQKANNIVQ